nr:uncharacterized protein LOC116428026 [Nomia melanderi]
MSKELPVYRDYTSLVKRCQLACGLYPHQQSIVSKYLPRVLILSYCINSYAWTVPFYRLGYYAYICLVFTATLYSIKPLIAMTVRHANHSTPLPSIYPWPIDSTAIFVLHYLFETGICYSFFAVATGVDMYFTLCAFYIATQFRAMARELKRLPEDRNDVANSVNVLRSCIRRHALLIKCRDDIQEIYGPIVLTVTTLNTVGMCGMIFEILQQTKEITIEKACTLIIFLTGKVLQTLTYAWPGDVVAYESEIFQREVYSNDWFDHVETRSAKLTLMILTQRKMSLNACSLLNISLDLFAKIMNKTISYYFLLVTLESDE